jgi:hypothetical protein
LLRPTIAFLALGATSVSPIKKTTESVKELNSIRDRALSALKNLEANVVDPFKGVILDLDDARRVVSSLKGEDFDALLLFFASWAQEEVPNSLGAEYVGRIHAART